MLAAGTFGPGPQMVAGLLTMGAKDLFTRIFTGTLMDKPPWSMTDPATPGEFHSWVAGGGELGRQHWGSYEEAIAQNPELQYLGVMAPGEPKFDMWTGEFSHYADPENAPPGPPPPSLDAFYASQPSYATPQPTPQPFEPWTYEPPTRTTWPEDRYGYPDLPSEGRGSGGNAMSIMSPTSLIGGLGDLIGEVGKIALKTAPIWTPYLPQPSAPAPPVFMPTTTPAPGGGSMSQFPIAMPGGAPIYAPSVTPAFGIPGADLAPTGSIPIVPNPVTGSLPSTVLAPYRTACGRPSWTIYRKMGRPALYSGDFAAAKRVKRVASRAKRRSGGR